MLKIIIALLLSITVISCAKNNKSSLNNGTDSKTDNEIDKQDNTDQLKPKVIYGNDDRLDLYQVNDPAVLALADATVALVKGNRLEENTSGITEIDTYHFGENYNLCKNEPFYEQPVAAFCSGSLVGEDLIMTAGHCISSKADCSNTKFVFGFGVKEKGELPNSVASSEVYGCKEVITSIVKSRGADYALVKLDRKVTNHKPLSIRRKGAIKVSEPLFVVGHPSGLPTKVAGGAGVRTVHQEYFVANLDTYGGNSGSAVFNGVTGKVEGILVRGDTDYRYKNGCRYSNVCEDGDCRGEDVTRVTELKKYIPELSIDIEPPSGNNDQVYEVEKKVNLIIPDNSEGGLSSTINADESPNGRKVEITVNIQHSWKGDLRVAVKTPSGQLVKLHNQSGRSENNIVGVYNIDLTPFENMESLSQVSQSGTWTLIISDHARWDSGELKNWGLKFK